MFTTSWLPNLVIPKICMLKDAMYRPSVGASRLRNRQKGTREGLIIHGLSDKAYERERIAGIGLWPTLRNN